MRVSIYSLLCGVMMVANTLWSENQMRQAVCAPGISGIEPLDESSALVRWDSVDAAVVDIRIMINERFWSGSERRDVCQADRGWIIVSGIRPGHSYRLQLSGKTAKDTCLPGPVFNYTHAAPIIDWVFVRGGEFEMGDSSDIEAARHQANFSAFLLSATEITNRDYLRYCIEDSVPLPEDPQFRHLREYMRRYPDYPVVNVTWYDAAAFCTWLSRKLDLPQFDNASVRLPTEAEWEMAAGFEHGAYPWGAEKPSPRLANFSSIGGDTEPQSEGPVAVRSYPATSIGFYDLAGNVWEWCSDWYAPYSPDRVPEVNPAGPSSGSYKVVRGGSWADTAVALRTTNRGHLSPSVAMSTVGFRVARSYPVSSPIIVNIPHVEENHALGK